MILEELDKEEYIEVLLGPEAVAQELPKSEPAESVVAAGNEPNQPLQPQVSGQNSLRQLVGRIPILGKMLGS